MKNSEQLTTVLLAKEASAFKKEPSIPQVLLGLAGLGAMGGTAGAAIGSAVGGLKGLANARPGMAAQDSVSGVARGMGVGAGTGAGALAGAGLGSHLSRGADSGLVKALATLLGAGVGGYAGNRLGKAVTTSGLNQDDADLENRRLQLERQTGSSKTASTNTLTNQNLLAASLMEKEAYAAAKIGLGLLGKGLGALGKGGLNRTGEFASKAWSAPMKFVGRGLGAESRVGGKMLSGAKHLDDFAAKRLSSANRSARRFGLDYMNATGKPLNNQNMIRFGDKFRKWGMGTAGFGGLAAAPMAAEATGIPGAGTVANAAAWGPVWAGIEKGIGAYQGAGQRGAQQATGAVLNQMQNASFMDRLGYLMAPGAAAGKLQGMANQAMPGFADYYNKTYGGA